MYGAVLVLVKPSCFVIFMGFFRMVWRRAQGSLSIWKLGFCVPYSHVRSGLRLYTFLFGYASYVIIIVVTYGFDFHCYGPNYTWHHLC